MSPRRRLARSSSPSSSVTATPCPPTGPGAVSTTSRSLLPCGSSGTTPPACTAVSTMSHPWSTSRTTTLSTLPHNPSEHYPDGLQQTWGGSPCERDARNDSQPNLGRDRQEPGPETVCVGPVAGPRVILRDHTPARREPVVFDVRDGSVQLWVGDVRSCLASDAASRNRRKRARGACTPFPRAWLSVRGRAVARLVRSAPALHRDAEQLKATVV